MGGQCFYITFCILSERQSKTLSLVFDFIFIVFWSEFIKNSCININLLRIIISTERIYLLQIITQYFLLINCIGALFDSHWGVLHWFVIFCMYHKTFEYVIWYQLALVRHDCSCIIFLVSPFTREKYQQHPSNANSWKLIMTSIFKYLVWYWKFLLFLKKKLILTCLFKI